MCDGCCLRQTVPCSGGGGPGLCLLWMLGGAVFIYYGIVLFGTWPMTLGVNVMVWIKARIETALGLNDDIKQYGIYVTGIEPC